jgi:hypothetical protein
VSAAVTPTACCPACGRAPALRFTADALAMLGDGDPQRVILTYQCHGLRHRRRPCRRVYEIRRRDILREPETIK